MSTSIFAPADLNYPRDLPTDALFEQNAAAIFLQAPGFK
jgi:hypothetical protein